ncbi:MAG: winged helix-turn-helix transcriptional regulator [Ferrovibrionaceae bacterium]|jgi:DNA-binding HxlR family transcriptional regulator
MTAMETCSGPAVSHLTGLDMRHIRLCPAIAFNQIVGGRYKLHILCVLHRGPARFGEIGRSLLHGGLGKPITPRILSRELKELEERGLVSRHAYPVVPKKVEYRLAAQGEALLPILAAIVRWGATGAHEQILKVA